MKKLSRYAWLGALIAIIIPVAFTFAQTTGLTYSGSFIENAFKFLKDSLRAIPAILVAFAGVIFMYEVVRFILVGKDDAAKKTEIRNHLLTSLVALVVLLSFWAIVRLISDSILGGGKQGTDIGSGDIPEVVI